MVGTRRVAKTELQILQDCETHLYFLWDALRLYPEQRDRYKQIAAELRVLVCESGRNRPLLLDCMDRYAFVYEILPPGPPLDKQPIALVNWQADPMHKAMADEVERAMDDPEKLDRLLSKQAALRRAMPLREYVNTALAVFIRPRDYSFRDLVLALAQQMGSSHEDHEVEETLVAVQSIFIGGHQGHIAPIIGFGHLVVRAGSEFLGFMIRKCGYTPRYFIVKDNGRNKEGTT